MTKVILRLVLTLFVTLAAGTPAPGASGVIVHEPWIREAPPNAMALAGYMVLENRSEGIVALVGASSAAFGDIMIHRTQVTGGMAEMIHQDRIELAPGAKLAFQPGGYHLMLMGPKQPLSAGDEAEITLRFSDGAKQPIRFVVRKAGAGSPSPKPH